MVDPKVDTKQGEDYEFIERASGGEELKLRQVALHEEVEDFHSGVGRVLRESRECRVAGWRVADEQVQEKFTH